MKKLFLFLLFALSESTDCFALSLKQQMDVQIGIFDAAKVTLNYKEEENTFDIQAKISTANFFDTLYPFLAHYKSYGKLGDKFLPVLYETRAQSRNHVRTKKVFYDKTGLAYKRISSKDEEVKERAIAKDFPNADAADLQTVFAELIHLYRQTGQCQLVREVYDGKKHYKAIVEDKGIDKRFFNVSGKEESTRLCAVYIENLQDNNDNILWDVTSDRPIKMWVGEDQQTKIPFIVEIVIDSTPLGALKVTPKSVDINKG